MATSSVGPRGRKDPQTEYCVLDDQCKPVRDRNGSPIISNLIRGKNGDILPFSWQARVGSDSHPMHVSTHATEKAARKWVERVKASILMHQCIVCAEKAAAVEEVADVPLTLGEVLDEYLARPAMTRLKRKSQYIMRCEADWLKRAGLPWGADRDVRTLRRSEVQRWRQARELGTDGERPVGPVRINALVSRVSLALDHYVEHHEDEGRLTANPIAGLRPLEKPEPLKRKIEPEELLAILPRLPLWLQLPLRVSYVYGLRNESELATLRWSWFRWTPGREAITLPAHTTKNGTERRIVLRIAPAVMEELRAMRCDDDSLVFTDPNGKPLVKEHFSGKPWRKAIGEAVAAGEIQELKGFPLKNGEIRMERLRWHASRHSARTNMGNAGIPNRAAQLILGHKSEQMSGVYDNPDPDDVFALVGDRVVN